MRISNIKVYGVEDAMGYAKLPMMNPTGVDNMLSNMERGVSPEQSDKALGRMRRLGATPIGSGHDNYLMGIIAQFTVDFTIKAWTEAERYHFFDIISSCSTMHALQKVNVDDAYIKYVDKRMVYIMDELINRYNDNPSSENFLNMVYSNPTGMKLTAAITTNYRQLKTIYYQRKDHRLPEWREFCKCLITDFPYFKELCLKDEVK